MVAVLAVARRVLGVRQQQTVPIVRARLFVVLEKAEPELLIVRVVADFRGSARQSSDQRRPVVPSAEIRRGQRDGLVGPQREQRFLQPLEQLTRRPSRRTRRRREGAT